MYPDGDMTSLTQSLRDLNLHTCKTKQKMKNWFNWLNQKILKEHHICILHNRSFPIYTWSGSETRGLSEKKKGGSHIYITSRPHQKGKPS